MNKKILLSVFFGLLASSASLIASLFMLQEIKSASVLKERVDNVTQAVQSINTTVDLTEVNDKIANLVAEINKLGTNVQDLDSNQASLIEQINGHTSSTPVTTTPPTTKPTTQPTTKPQVSTTKVSSTTDRLNFRVAPGKSGSLIKTLGKGAKLTLLNEEQDKDGIKWVKVQEASGKTGWVAKQYTK